MFDYELSYKITCDISQELKMNDIEYNSVCSAGRRIYFGGHGGFIAFDPQEIKVDVRRYPVRLTSFRLHNTPVLPGAEIDGKVILENSVTFSDQIRLRHDENFFRIDFALLNFATGAGNSYTYKLDAVSYTHLDVYKRQGFNEVKKNLLLPFPNAEISANYNISASDQHFGY